jgi:hypothetical protein
LFEDGVCSPFDFFDGHISFLYPCRGENQ